MQLVKVAWVKEGVKEYTWKLELDMRKDYPELFSSNKFCGQNFLIGGSNVTPQFSNVLINIVIC